jgi:hypothetical protein
LVFFYFYNSSKFPSTTTNGSEVIDTPSANPFGTNTGTRTSTTTPERKYPYNGGDKKLAILRPLYTYPNSGAVLLEKDGVTLARFVVRETGNVHEVASDSDEIKRITSNIIPRVLETVWSNSGNYLIYRYSTNDNDTIDNYLAKIKISTSTSNQFSGGISGNVVYKNADSIVINPSGNKSFAITKLGGMKGSYGLISSLEGGNSKEIFVSEVSNWLISWPKDNIISLVTKPSYKQYGYLYFLNTNDNSFEKKFGRVYGLNVLVNKNADSFIYSSSNRNSFKLNFYNIKTATDKNLQIETLADKCVWSNKDSDIVYCAVPKFVTSGNYPDAWYQGVISFSDNIWKINVEEGTTQLVYEIGKNESVSLDAMDLRINKDDSFLIFTDKNTLSLWGLQIAK